MGAPVAPTAKPLKPPVKGFVAPDEPAVLFNPEPNVGPVPSAPETQKRPLTLGCSGATEVVAVLDAFAEPPKIPPNRFDEVAAVDVKVKVDVEMVDAIFGEPPKNPPFRFGRVVAVGVAVEVDVDAFDEPPIRFGRVAAAVKVDVEILDAFGEPLKNPPLAAVGVAVEVNVGAFDEPPIRFGEVAAVVKVDVEILDAFGESPKNLPFGVAVGVSVKVHVEVAVVIEGPGFPPLLLFVDVGAFAYVGAAAAATAAPLIVNPPNRAGGAEPSDVAFAEAGTSFSSPEGDVSLEYSVFPFAGARAEELLWPLKAITSLPNGPPVLKLGAGLGRGRVRTGLGGSAGWVVAGNVPKNEGALVGSVKTTISVKIALW